jgi:hypothetical protein
MYGLSSTENVVMRRMTVVTMNICVCWDQVPCSVGGVAFWTNMLLLYSFYPRGLSHMLSKIQYRIVPTSSLYVKPTVIDLLPLLICPISRHLTCCPSSTAIVWHHVQLNSASTPHSPALGPSSHIALLPVSLASCPSYWNLFPMRLILLPRTLSQ